MKEDVLLIRFQGQVLGPYPVSQLRRMPGFSSNTFVSYPGTDKWAPAHRVLHLKTDFEPAVVDSRRVQYPQALWDPIHPNFIPTSKMRVIEGPIADHPGRGGVDRWFRRLVLFNSLLAAISYGAWSYPPARQVVQNEWREILNAARPPMSPVITRTPKRPAASRLARANGNRLRVAVLHKTRKHGSHSRLLTAFLVNQPAN